MAIDPMGKMLASMLGITPEKVEETVASMVNMGKNLDARLTAIESKLDTLYCSLHNLNFESVPLIEERKDAA